MSTSRSCHLIFSFPRSQVSISCWVCNRPSSMQSPRSQVYTKGRAKTVSTLQIRTRKNVIQGDHRNPKCQTFKKRRGACMKLDHTLARKNDSPTWCGVIVVVWCYCGGVVLLWWCGVTVVVWCYCGSVFVVV